MEQPSHLADLRATTVQQMADLNEAEVLQIVKERIALGDNPFSIVEDCRKGLEIVGDLYEKREYFLSGLIMAGEIFQEIIQLVDPTINGKYLGNKLGKVVLGTVAGDIHSIGKNVFGTMLISHGFTVYDLGVDVPAEEFLQKAIEIKPDIIGLSSLLTSSQEAVKETVKLIRTNADEFIMKIPIAVGGGSVDAEMCKRVGADHWANDAMTGVRLFKQTLEIK